MSDLKLLPSSAVDFSSTDYWDSFFTKRKADFEWYGEFDELAPLLRKFCSTKHSMLIVGCGSSNLSDRLYSDGYRNQLSIDISSVIINRMQNAYPHLTFKEDDVTNLHCSDEEFFCVLDKGTFDALAPPPPKKHGDTAIPDRTAETQKSIQMLNEVQRVLKGGGRFVCISLLQAHVAELLIGYFVKLGWMIKINRCEAAESRNGNSSISFPVYVCLFLKPLKAQPESPTETFIDFVGLENGGKSLRLKSVSEVLECLKNEMTKKFYAAAMKTIGHCANAENEWTLCEADGKAKYKLFVVDILALAKNPVGKQMVIFIIPQGREMEYMFATHEGRSIIAKQMGFTRAVFVALQRDRDYPSRDEVQKEIGNNVQFVTPDAVANAKVKIPIVTAGSDLGSREIIHRGQSEFSGQFTVEDVKVGTNILRRLIFLDAPNIIQSEVPLKVTTHKVKGQSTRRETRIPVSHQLTSDYHGIMALALPMRQFFFKQEETETVETLLIGLGGGLLVSFLHHYFPNLRMTAVELDKEIAEVGRNYFGLKEHEGDGRLRIIIEDGLKFLQETGDTKFDVIMFDVDNKSITSGLSCPPTEFLTDETLKATSRALTSEGIFVLNFVCRNSALEEKYLTALSSQFPFIYKFKLAKEVNSVFLCFSKSPPGNSKLFSKSLAKSVQCIRDIQLQDVAPNRKSKQLTSTSHVDVENQTEDTIVGLTDAGLEDLCAKFKIIRIREP